MIPRPPGAMALGMGAKLGLRRPQKTISRTDPAWMVGPADTPAALTATPDRRPAADTINDSAAEDADAGHPQVLAVCPAPRRRGQSRIKAHAGMRCGSRPAPPIYGLYIYVT